ncbi:hypothetical protein BZB76_0942 [Actinomadura pelletieri DSM 43383]|uniref:Uncharacterized protein n=1 Tax=Actinomadura pelletieri DSM 43383 TaxID=1120940 RepID=A0A495R037_9ACTN|nr:hypothetical protein [Actinomadura pelletieri]RKS79476.1 hypothetical protein BZB76_0942 [Actinomadura pelletieri DSM 43383]
MVFLGSLLVVAAIAAVVGVILGNTGSTSLVAFGQTVPGVDELWQVFLAGAVTAVVFIAGMALGVIGTVRLVRTRRDLRDLREEHEESLTTLEMEKRRLQRELARVRQAAAQADGSGGGSSSRGRQSRRGAPAAAQGTRVGPRSQVAASSPFFDRKE